MIFNNILPIGIRDLQSFHEERRKSGDESGDGSGDESGDKSGDESGDESDDGDQSSEEVDMDLMEQNLHDLEATMSIHSIAFLPYRYTRLPCAAHKVRLDWNPWRLYYTFLCDQVHTLLFISLLLGQSLGIFRSA